MLRTSLYLCTASSFLVIFLLLGFIFYASWPLFELQGLAFLTETDWFPYEDYYGMVPALLGTFWSVLLALFIAVPCGVAAAIVSAELLPASLRQTMRLGMEVLAGIPSVVYGLIGLWVLLPFLEQTFDLLTGRSLLAAGLLLAMMVLPTIMVLSEDALRKVSNEQKEAALSLGLNWQQCLFKVSLPQAWPGIRVATLLALGRAMGETVAVMLVVGSIDRLPEPIYNLFEPAQTLTSRIGREMAEASLGSMHWSALMMSGLLLAVAAIGISMLTQKNRNMKGVDHVS